MTARYFCKELDGSGTKVQRICYIRQLPSNPYELLEFDSDVTGIQPHIYHRIFAKLQSH